ncbi:MAG: hypothetical protein AAF317_14165, partial [Pseudomonadota bacterium]
ARQVVACPGCRAVIASIRFQSSRDTKWSPGRLNTPCDGAGAQVTGLAALDSTTCHNRGDVSVADCLRRLTSAGANRANVLCQRPWQVLSHAYCPPRRPAFRPV